MNDKNNRRSRIAEESPGKIHEDVNRLREENDRIRQENEKLRRVAEKIKDSLNKKLGGGR